jgi:peroxiredoxin (alkyl hydroperoxide reductase subunit C)
LIKVSSDDYLGKYLVILFYPHDFSYAPPTELIAFSDRLKELNKLNTKVIAVSTDSLDKHLSWINTKRS